MFRIAIPLYPKALVTGISGPMEMFHAAENLAVARHRSLEPVAMTTVSENGASVECTGGLRIEPHTNLEQAGQQDLIVLAPIWGNPMTTVRQSQPLQDWLVQQHRGGATLIATGTTVCLLAETGLLDNKTATTHWYFFERFRRLYPQVELNTHQFVTFSDNIYCAGSINALSDLILYLIDQRYGSEISRVVEQHFSHEINRTYEKPFFLQGGNQHHDEEIVRAQEWINQHWAEDVSLQRWCDAIDLSIRTMNRRFREATGVTPIRYLQDLRISKARELLRDTNLPVAEVAEMSGYRDQAYFARLFRQRTDMSPHEYRKMVRGKTFFVVPQEQ